jgi:hypothetical protein
VDVKTCTRCGETKPHSELGRNLGESNSLRARTATGPHCIRVAMRVCRSCGPVLAGEAGENLLILANHRL